MSTRNTPVLQAITERLFTDLDEQEKALDRLEHHFQHQLLVNAGNVFTIGEHAEQLRLRITDDERSIVLDYIAEKQTVTLCSPFSSR